MSGRDATVPPKDLVDILLIANSTTIDAGTLRQALESTFGQRARQPLPTCLPPPPATWEDPYKRMAETVNVEADLIAAFDRAAAFLDPVLAGRTSGRWDPERWEWVAPAE